MILFDEGFEYGTKLPREALPVLHYLRDGGSGTSGEVAVACGLTSPRASKILRTMYELKMIRITAWRVAGLNTVAVYSWGEGIDTARPPGRRSKRQIDRDKRDAATRAERRNRERRMAEETTEAEIEEAQVFRRTMHGRETQNGNVRTHRME